jgi:hypothetical protein
MDAGQQYYDSARATLQRNRRTVLIALAVVLALIAGVVVWYFYYHNKKSDQPDEKPNGSVDACSAFKAAVINVKAQRDQIVAAGCNREGLEQLMQTMQDIISTAKSNPMERRDVVLAGVIRSMREAVAATQCNQATGAALADVVDSGVACAQMHWSALSDEERAQFEQAAGQLIGEMHGNGDGNGNGNEQGRPVQSADDACAAFDAHYQTLRAQLSTSGNECKKMLVMVERVKRSVDQLRQQRTRNADVLSRSFIDNMNESVNVLNMSKECLAHVGAVVMFIYRAADCLVLRLQDDSAEVTGISRAEQQVIDVDTVRERVNHYRTMLRAYVDEWVGRIKEQVSSLQGGSLRAPTRSSAAAVPAEALSGVCPCGCADGRPCTCGPSCPLCDCNGVCDGGCPYADPAMTPYHNQCTKPFCR